MVNVAFNNVQKLFPIDIKVYFIYLFTYFILKPVTKYVLDNSFTFSG